MLFKCHFQSLVKISYVIQIMHTVNQLQNLVLSSRFSSRELQIVYVFRSFSKFYQAKASVVRWNEEPANNL